MRKYITILLIIICHSFPSYAQRPSKSVPTKKAYGQFIEKSFFSSEASMSVVFKNKKGIVTVKSSNNKTVRMSSSSKSKVELDNMFDFKVTSNNEILVTQKTSKNQETDVQLEIPENSNLEITKEDDGEVRLMGLNSNIKVNAKGNVFLENIRGWANVNTIDGNITAMFTEVIPDKNMSFISLKGDIFVKFPRGTEANIKVINPEAKGVTISEANGDIQSMGLAKNRGENELGLIDKYELPKTHFFKSDKTNTLYFFYTRNGKVSILRYK